MHSTDDLLKKVELQRQIDEHEERLMSLELWRKHIKILADQSIKPHKCPVCDGKCKVMYSLPGGGFWEEKCKSCDGVGILWK